jgi:hypothetical protein
MSVTFLSQNYSDVTSLFDGTRVSWSVSCPVDGCKTPSAAIKYVHADVLRILKIKNLYDIPKGFHFVVACTPKWGHLIVKIAPTVVRSPLGRDLFYVSTSNIIQHPFSVSSPSGACDRVFV